MFFYAIIFVSIIVSLFLLLSHIFSWTLLWSFMELSTIHPFLNIYVIYGGVFFLSIICLFICRQHLLAKRTLPVIINITVMLLLVFVPFREMGLSRDIQNNFEKRLEVIELISQGSLHPNNRGQVKLPFSLSYLSKDGGIVFVKKNLNDHSKQILFFTFRGVLDNFSGILYSSNDIVPNKKIFGGDIKKIKRIKENWYWIVSF